MITNEFKEIVLSTIREFNGENIIKNKIRLLDGQLLIKGVRLDLKRYRNLYIIGFGKASGEMAKGIEEILSDYIDDGVIIVPHELVNKYSGLEKIRVYGGKHPYPTSMNLESTRKLLKLVDSLRKDDLVICLISGGGSALLTHPAKGLSIQDVNETTKKLMLAGADIYELNTVRKHISMVKGGRLAKIIHPAKTLSLIISDVVGDDVSTIASGPTSPDPTTYKDALQVIKKYNLMNSMPHSVLKIIYDGIEGIIEETPKANDPIFKNVRNLILANNYEILNKISQKLRHRHHRTKVITSFLVGEAREVGKTIASIGKMILRKGRPFKSPIILLFGGETTVTVKGRGVGGRNQELALSTALELYGYGDYIILSIATDGIDGNSPAAGAIMTNIDIKKALDSGLDPLKYLDNNDTYNFHKTIGTAINTGYTGTNLNDIFVMALY